MAKPTGSVCNLDCAYCFFLEKEKLYPGARAHMSDELLERYIRQLVESHRTPQVEIAWQGGEPMLMGLEFFRRAVELGKKYARPGTTVVHTIQTNGTKINGDWARFFKENGFLVGLSIDGPRDIHDTYRRDKAGKPTFDKVMRGLAALREHEVEWNALTTVNAANEDRSVEVYRFLRDDCGCEFMQFIPIVERPSENGVPVGSEVTERSVSPRGWGRFLIGVFDEWVRRDVGEVFVQLFDVSLANWYGEPSGLCVHTASCGAALAMEFNGDVYACDHFVEPGYLRGNINESHLAEIVGSAEQIRFGDLKVKSLPNYCVHCDVRFACHGGCPKDRFVRRRRASRGSTTSAPATRTSSTTSTSRCAACATCCARTARRPTSSRSTAPRSSHRGGDRRYRICLTAGLPCSKCAGGAAGDRRGVRVAT